jgi:hypothetical protein
MRNGLALAAALVVSSAGCSRCGISGGPPPERFLPADAPVAVIVPRLRTAQEQAAPLLRTVLSFPAAADLGEKLAAVRSQLGFDPLDARALQEAGVDPGRGAGLALSAREPPLLVLPVADAGKLEALVARIARDRLGAGRRGHVSVGGASVVAFSTQDGAPPAMAWLVVHGSALLAPGPNGPARVAAAAAMPEAQALGASAAYLSARAALGEEPAALAFAPPGSPTLAQLPLLRDGAVLGASGSGARLALRAALLLPKGRADWWRAALGGDSVAVDALARLPADAFLTGRSAADPAVLARRALPWLAPASATALARLGLDPQRDVFDLLAPGIALSLSLAPTFEVAAVSRGAAELGVSDPFRLVHLAAVLEVKDPARVEATLDRLARSGPELGVAVARQRAGAPGWRVAHGGAEVRVALDGNRLLVAGGPGRLEALLAREGGPAYAPPSDTARAALRGGVAGAVLDLGQLVTSFRALPQQAYGTGPDAFVMRSLAERVVDPASRLSAASLRIDLAGEAARAELVVEARSPEAARR